MMLTIKDRIKGCLIGGAIGDALGYPVESMKINQIKQLYGPHGLTNMLTDLLSKKALISDDTQLTLFTISGILNHYHNLISNGHNNLIMDSIYPAYMRWYYTQSGEAIIPSYISKTSVEANGVIPFILDEQKLYANRKPGSLCLSTLGSGKIGKIDQPINNNNDCSCIMRAAPFGLLNISAQSSFEIGAASAAITHGHHTSILTTGALASIISYLVNGEKLETAIENTISILLEYKKMPLHYRVHIKKYSYKDIFNRKPYSTYGQLADTYIALNDALKATHFIKLPAEQDIQSFGPGYHSNEVLSIALYCALREEDPVKSLLYAVNIDGKSDSSGAICGCVLGALYGTRIFPEKWIEKLELYDYIDNFSDLLYQSFYNDLT